MKLAEKLTRIQETLDRLIPEVPIPLDHVDPFTLLVAVVLSAQTTDKKVNEVTPALFARAKTPEAMAKLSVKEVHGLIRTVGLAPAKAKALVGLAKQIVAKHGGQVPRTLEELVELPGVGRKTASVVLCQAFGIPAFPVDTHIHRLAQRWGLTSGKSVEQTERDLRRRFPEHSWAKLHLQIIYFGRRYCPAQRHDQANCPICSFAARRGTAKARESAAKPPGDRRTSTARSGRRGRNPPRLVPER
jgi:endonuclease-3